MTVTHREYGAGKKVLPEPLVSVVMVTYNQAAYIAEAVKSVSDQHVDFPFELIIGDDCSTDGTWEIAQSYQRLYPDKIRLFRPAKNLGPRANFDGCLDAARGSLIAFCEGDDFWVRGDKLQAQVDYLRRNPKHGAVHTNYLHLIMLRGAWRTRPAYRTEGQMRQREGWLCESLLSANLIQTCTLLCRRELIEEYRAHSFSTTHYAVGDWPMYLHLSHAAPIGFLRACYSAYRRTKGSITNAGAVNALHRGRDALRMTLDFCDHFNIPFEMRQKSQAALHRRTLRLAFAASDSVAFSESRKWLLAQGFSLGIREAMLSMLIRFPIANRTALRLLASIEWLKHTLEFRRAPAKRAS